MKTKPIDMTTQSFRFTVKFTEAEDGGYTVTCPDLPGVLTEGDSFEQARANMEEAILAYLESLAKDGLPSPKQPKAQRRFSSPPRAAQRLSSPEARPSAEPAPDRRRHTR